MRSFLMILTLSKYHKLLKRSCHGSHVVLKAVKKRVRIIMSQMTFDTAYCPGLGERKLLAAEVLEFISRRPAADAPLNIFQKVTKIVFDHPNLLRVKKVLDLSLFFEGTPEEVAKKQALFLEALTHTSFINEFQELSDRSYERIEFLGDSVIGLLFTDYLIKHFPRLEEGELSRFRSSLVNEQSLAKLARFIHLGHVVLLGRGELKSKGYQRTTILSDVFEAIFGALYLASGIEQCQRSFDHLLQLYKEEKNEEFISLETIEFSDAKTRLQELCMLNFKQLPVYRDVQHDDQSFSVELVVCGTVLASERNISKKKAQKNLAIKALKEDLLKGVGNVD